MKSISKGKLFISIKEHGAELASLKYDGREYLWQADEKFWKRHSPVLFPIVGAVWNNEYKSHSKTFAMGQHGFARDMDFTLVSESEDELIYKLSSNEDTLAKYPYPFNLIIGYKISNHGVRVSWTVENPGDEKMAFQIGAHPAFFWPLLNNSDIEAGVDEMEKKLEYTGCRGFFKLTESKKTLPVSVITEKGCVGANSEVITDEKGYLEINTHTFDNDALIFEDYQLNCVTLCDNQKRPYLQLKFNAPLVALWSPPKKRAPFVCIEPWYGRTDFAGYEDIYENKCWMNFLEPKEVFSVSYDIIIPE